MALYILCHCRIFSSLFSGLFYCFDVCDSVSFEILCTNLNELGFIVDWDLVDCVVER